MKIMALIPARAGSKRCPGKNMATLCGKPMIQWSIEAALDCKFFDDIVVSTDDTKIIDWLPIIYHPVEVRLIERPVELALDITPMLPVVKHTVHHSPRMDAIVLLQPTSPFRSASDIHAALDLLKRSGGDSVVSITDPEEDLTFRLGHANRLVPQTNIVVPNGAIYIITTDALERGENWYSGVAYAYRMPKDRSIDINTPIDLMMAKAVAEQNNAA
jgi:CMP-N,N'-diacetyllegionaminic acid synthase